MHLFIIFLLIIIIPFFSNKHLSVVVMESWKNTGKKYYQSPQLVHISDKRIHKIYDPLTLGYHNQGKCRTWLFSRVFMMHKKS